MEGENLIVSLTSHPGRIATTWLAIESLMKQTYKPDQIILSLAAEDFPDRVLPHELNTLVRRGLKIYFSDINYYAATKLLPVLRQHPHATIVTADDDRIYSANWLETLVKCHYGHKGCIVSGHVRKWCLRGCLSENDEPRGNEHRHGYPCVESHHTSPIDYQRQDARFDEEIFGIFEGFAGVLYPPGALDARVFDIDSQLTFAPIADDIWFQTMAALNGTKCVSPTEKAMKLVSFEEISGTQECGLFHQHLVADDIMAYECMRQYGLLHLCGLPDSRTIKCARCRRNVNMQKWSPQAHIDCRGCLSQTRRVILCVGSYDHGNIGDNIYRELFEKIPDYIIKCCPDSVLMSPDGKYVPIGTTEVINYDILVIGGGGILGNLSHGLLFWLNHARKYAKPVFILSVGFQDDAQIPAEHMHLINQAQFITVRSYEDYKLLNTTALTYVVRDMGYSYAQMAGISKAAHPKYITLIPTGSCNIGQAHIRKRLGELFKQHPDAQLLVMNWGGIEEPGAYERDEIMNIRDYYPNALIFRGDSLSHDLHHSIHAGKNIRRSDLTPRRAVELIAQSHHVLTGRYHGMIVARSLGVQCESYVYNHKCRSEMLMDAWAKEKITHVQMLLGYVQASGWLYDHHQWDDDTRNGMICRVHAMTGIDVAHIQAMNNQMLFEIIVGLRTRV